jgi:2-hydroxy-3-keto-5-methylthiopentenyl-1-phosphate phosphatase
VKTIVQCDFDGTITEGDVSFVLLDAFARGDWRRLESDYQERRISVQDLNARAFAMVKADASTLLKTIDGKVRVRAGFQNLVSYCRERRFRLVIVSNGLDFYIRAILKDLHLEDIEVISGQACFRPEGIEVRYLGPDGRILEDGFKETYVRSFRGLGYRLIYMGNGESDIAPARHAHHVFATDRLLSHARKHNLDWRPLGSFVDAVREIALLS